MSNDQRNMMIAIVLSLIVVVGWQYFIVGPQMEEAQREAEIAAQQQQDQDAADVTAPQSGEAAGEPGAVDTSSAATTRFETREAAIESQPRVAIDTPALTGSINLVGGRIDDLSLKNYRTTPDPDSPIIDLLAPANGPSGYYAEQGWVASGNSSVAVPGNRTQWSVAEDATLTADSPVTLTWDNGSGLVFERTIAVDDHYLFTVTQTVTNETGGDVALYPYSRVVRHGIPALSNFFILHEGPIGVLGDNNLIERSYEDLASERQIDFSSTGGWLGFTDKYWATSVIPSTDETVNARFSSRGANNQIYEANFVDQTPVVVPAGGTADNTSYVFSGAKVEATIDDYEQNYGFDRFELLIDWGWFHFITKPMFYLIRFLFEVLGNFGLAILAVTLIVKAVFFPLANKSYASMARMRVVQPQMKEIQEKYKDDRQEQQKQMMELYQREKINPLSGCWPILIQIPVFFALYKVLFVTIEMRHAPFFGWVQDLAAPDPSTVFNLFGLIPFDPAAVPVIGAFLAIGIWPVLMGITMWVQMRLNPPPPDPTQQMIFNWMPVVFTFMLGTFPAGLVIYWAWNNFLSVIQQYIIMKRNGAEVNLLGNIAASFKRSKPAKENPNE